MSRTFSLTPVQQRDKKIKDLETQLENEKNARRNEREQSGNDRSVVLMLQRTIASYAKTIKFAIFLASYYA